MSKTVNPDTQRKPVGGHHYHEGDTKVTGDSFIELLDNLRDLRIANGGAIGDPLGDVVAYYEKIAPWILVEDEEGVWDGEQIPAHLRPMQRWLDGVWKAGSITLVSGAESKTRQEGCKGCKYASEFEWDVGVEGEEMRKRLEIMKRTRKTPLDTSYCKLHKWHNGLATLMIKPRFGSAAKERSPSKCFVHSLRVE
jgi:hypothetical protein